MFTDHRRLLIPASMFGSLFHLVRETSVLLVSTTEIHSVMTYFWLHVASVKYSFLLSTTASCLGLIVTLFFSSRQLINRTCVQ